METMTDSEMKSRRILDETLDLLSRDMIEKAEDAAEYYGANAEEAIVKLYEASRYYKDTKIDNRSDLLGYFVRLNREDGLLDDFLNLSTSHQEEILNFIESFDFTRLLKSYLKVLKLSGNPKPNLVFGNGFAQLNILNRNLAETCKPLLDHNVSEVSIDFEEKVKLFAGAKAPINGFMQLSAAIMTITMILRYIYGEKLLKEILEKFVAEGQQRNAELLIRVIDDWDNVKDYPLAWIENFPNFENI